MFLHCFFTIVTVTASALALDVPIINAKTEMAPGEQLVLSVMNYQTGNAYTSIENDGGGTLSADTGESVTCTVPILSPDCENNPTITATVNGA